MRICAIGTAESMTGVVEGYYDSPILASIMQTANWSADKIKLADTALTVTEVRRAMTGNASSIVKEFNDKIKSMTKDMQKAANLTAYGNLMQMVTDFRESVDKTNKDTDENTFGRMFREKGYKRDGSDYERDVVSGYSLSSWENDYKDIVTQKVKSYKYYNIPGNLLQFDVIKSEKELAYMDPDEAGILVKLEMENIKEDMEKVMPNLKNDREYKFGGYAYERPDPKSFKYENYKESIYYHIGNAPVDFDSEEESFDYDGHGEMGRIVAKLTLNDMDLGQYRGKYESGYLSGFQLYEGADLSALEDIDLSGGKGTFNLKDLLNIFTLGVLNWVDGGSLMDMYSTGTQMISSVGSCIAGGAASAAGTGISIAVNAGMQAASYGIQTGTSYLEMRQSTVGYSEEEKQKALNNWGTGRVFGLIGTANSIGASALGSMAGGAVTGASGNAIAGAVVGGLVTTGSENAGNYISDFGQSMMSAGFKSYQQGDINLFGDNLLNEMGSRFTLGRFAGEQVSAGFGALSSLAGAGISNPYGGGMVSTLIGQVGKEASFWTQQSIDTGINYARTGQYDQNYFANLASERYGNGDFWSGLALDYGKSAFTTLASSNIENTYLKNLATSAISNGFDSASGRTSFSINTIMQQASIGTMTDGIDELIKEAIKKEFEKKRKEELGEIIYPEEMEMIEPSLEEIELSLVLKELGYEEIPVIGDQAEDIFLPLDTQTGDVGDDIVDFSKRKMTARDYKRIMKDQVKFDTIRLLKVLKTGGKTDEEKKQYELIKTLYENDPNKNKYSLEKFAENYVKANSLLNINDPAMLKSLAEERFGKLNGVGLFQDYGDGAVLTSGDNYSTFKEAVFDLNLLNTISIASNIYYLGEDLSVSDQLSWITTAQPKYKVNSKGNRTSENAFQGINEDGFSFKMPVQEGNTRYNKTLNLIGEKSLKWNNVAQKGADAVSLLTGYLNAYAQAKQISQAYVLLRKDNNGNKYFNVIVPTTVPKNDGSGATLIYKPTYIQNEDELYDAYKDIIKQMLVADGYKWNMFDF